MSQATEHTTENGRERYPSLTFMDPASDPTLGGTANNADKLDYAADVLAFVTAAVAEPPESGFTEQERCGLTVILRSVEHTLRRTSELVPMLEEDLDRALRDYTTAHMTGRNDAESERAKEKTATYPRFNKTGAGEGEEVISDASYPEDSDRRHGGAAG